MTFEVDLCNKYGMRVEIFDPSPTGEATCEKLDPKLQIEFKRMGLAGAIGELEFSEPLDGESYQANAESSHRRKLRLPCTTISEIIKQKKGEFFSLLKIDIEGCEYEVLHQLLNENPNTFPQIAVEFHHRLPGMNVWKQRFKTLLLVLRMRFSGYILIHKCGGDFTFIKKQFL